MCAPILSWRHWPGRWRIWKVLTASRSRSDIRAISTGCRSSFRTGNPKIWEAQDGITRSQCYCKSDLYVLTFVHFQFQRIKFNSISVVTPFEQNIFPHICIFYLRRPHRHPLLFLPVESKKIKVYGILLKSFESSDYSNFQYNREQGFQFRNWDFYGIGSVTNWTNKWAPIST